MIIIDIEWSEKNYCDNFLGHIAQPYIKPCKLLLLLYLILKWLMLTLLDYKYRFQFLYSLI